MAKWVKLLLSCVLTCMLLASCKTSAESGNDASTVIVGGKVGAAIAVKMKQLRATIPASATTVETINRGEGLKATILSSQLFAPNSNRLTDSAMSTLTGLAAALNGYPDTNIRIVAHTDKTGEDELNRKLSERRAMSVGKALTDSGLDAARLKCEGRGFNEPKADNSTREGRALNRRVEIFITPSAKMIDEARRKPAQ